MTERKASIFSKITSEIRGLTQRQTQPKRLKGILLNLDQVPENEREFWAQKVFYYNIAHLHDMPEEMVERALDNLRIAGAVKERYNLKWIDPPGGDSGILEYRRKQFLQTNTFLRLPPEGIALTVFLTKETDQSMKDFVRGESAKIKIRRDDYIFENLSEEHPSYEPTGEPAAPVTKNGPQKTDDEDGFDPFEPKTWKKP